jgi:long-chain acyl-CoA synthetase
MIDRRVDGPEPREVPATDHLLSTLWAGPPEGTDPVLLSRPRGDDWGHLTWTDLVDRVRSVAGGLVAHGLEPGDRVAIMSPTRLEWLIADLAVLAAGAVSVPVYDTSSLDQCHTILANARPRLAFVATSGLGELLAEAAPADRQLEDLVAFDDAGLGRLARDADPADLDEVDRRVSALCGDDLATIVYTSGTTGDPKGCELTHRNLVWTVRQSLLRLDGVLEDTDSTLLFLPLAHIFTRVVMYVALERGLHVGFARSLDHLPEDLRTFHPTFLLAVPRVFEKVFRTAQRQATGAKAPIFDLAVRTGEAFSLAEHPSVLLRLQHRVSDVLVYAKLRAAVGGKVRFCVSGGAALNPRLGRFFQSAGITILEGYGLTETSAPATMNTPDELRIGTVGRPIPGVSIRMAEDGELLVSGGNVFRGYHRNPDATGEVFDDEWFRTGDIGTIDDDGYVLITDRKKELIVTATGKNVAPVPLEQRIREHPFVANAMVVGDGRPFLGAVVAVDVDELRSSGLTIDDEEVRRQVQQAIDDANVAVSRAEAVRSFRLVGRDFTEQDEELTPTLKLRRRTILAHFADEIESIYADS